MPGTVPQRADVPASPPVEMIRGSKLSPLANPLPRHDGVRGSRPGTVPVGTVRPCRTFPGFVHDWMAGKSPRFAEPISSKYAAAQPWRRSRCQPRCDSESVIAGA